MSILIIHIIIHVNIIVMMTIHQMDFLGRIPGKQHHGSLETLYMYFTRSSDP